MIKSVLEGDASAFGVGQGPAGGFVGEEDGGGAVVGVGVDAVVDCCDVEAFGQDFEVAGVASVGDEEVADGGARHGLDALGGSFGRGVFEGGATEDGRGHPGSTGFAPEGVGEDADPLAVEAHAADLTGDAVHEDVGAAGGPEGGEEHAVEVGLAEIAVLAADGLAIGGGRAHRGE